jgi:uncharacterized membrane protein
MNTERLQAFSDAVIAIIITIMVIELHPPITHELNDFIQIVPKFIAYLFSFLIIAIYWNNHHHLLKPTSRVSPVIMWSNMLLLFCLSLVPFGTAWLGESRNYLNEWPVFIYSVIALLCAVAYYILSKSIAFAHPNTKLEEEINNSKKGLVSLIIYILSAVFSFISPIISLFLLATTALIWFIPSKQLETLVDGSSE